MSRVAVLNLERGMACAVGAVSVVFIGQIWPTAAAINLAAGTPSIRRWTALIPLTPTSSTTAFVREARMERRQ